MPSISVADPILASILDWPSPQPFTPKPSSLSPASTLPSPSLQSAPSSPIAPAQSLATYRKMLYETLRASI